MSSNITGPSRAELRAIGTSYGMDLSDADIEAFSELSPFLMESYRRVEALPSEDLAGSLRDVAGGRREFTFRPSENPYNVWITTCAIEGSDDGPLAGYDVGLKDNIMLAEVPMTCGCSAFEEYVPTRDATVVTRLLDAGARITGKVNMDAMAFASSGELSFTGQVTNPRIPDHLAGGSSSGSAAAVAAGVVDVSIGSDQAGSVRIPASFCGCVGLKPTHGLVPYTGIVGQGYTFDHVGPLANSVTDCARTLEVIAGPDLMDGEIIDPRQHGVDFGDISADYTSFLNCSDPLEIGVLAEGFDRERSHEGVDDTAREALAGFAGADVTLREISVPIHADGMHIWACVIAESNVALLAANGVGYFVNGEYDPEFAKAFDEILGSSTHALPSSMQLTLIVGRYMADQHHGYFHAKAQNLRRTLRRAYDRALDSVDVLALPTTIYPAYEKRDDLSRVEEVTRAYGAVENTSPFDMTGHPAISVPCGTTDGLPVGLMFVADRFDEPTLLRAAHRFESTIDEFG